MTDLLDIVLHVDKYLGLLITTYGIWVYAILFLIIFCETGLVVTPFLPGDSLLFAMGTFAAQGWLKIEILTGILFVAPLLGDITNYSLGRWLGPKVFSQDHGKLLRKDYLMKAHAFYEKHGGKALIMARFVPIVRTFAPFVAGVASMTFRRFILFSITGAILWMTLLLYGGFFLGNIPLIKNNFEKAILLILFVSVLPIGIEYLKARRKKATA